MTESAQSNPVLVGIPVVQVTADGTVNLPMTHTVCLGSAVIVLRNKVMHTIVRPAHHLPESPQTEGQAHHQLGGPKVPKAVRGVSIVGTIVSIALAQDGDEAQTHIVVQGEVLEDAVVQWNAGVVEVLLVEEVAHRTVADVVVHRRGIAFVGHLGAAGPQTGLTALSIAIRTGKVALGQSKQIWARLHLGQSKWCLAVFSFTKSCSVPIACTVFYCSCLCRLGALLVIAM